MSLTTYKKKRKFKETSEPSEKGKSTSKKLIFVVQRHDASHLHYDFRLQVDGVLKSWAVPKGPSLNPKDKRLAVMVEDHPLSYAKFHGEIPEGNYGAGTVEIFDTGTYEPVENSAQGDKEILSELKKGNIKFILHGKKLKGSFALVRLKGQEKNWLLIKHKDEFAVFENAGISEVIKQKKETSAAKNIYRSVRSGKAEKYTEYIKPMLAHLHEKPFDAKDWVFEIKWDGYRAIAEIQKNNIKLYSRNGLSFAQLYPIIFNELKKIKENIILDGEIVVLDKNNKPSFQKLQHYEENKSLPIVYYVFDCLSIKGKSITNLTLIERKKIARQALPESSIIRYSEDIPEEGVEFFSKAVAMDLEGIIAKRANSSYLTGKRSNDWLKIKNHNTQEAIIAGFTAPRNSRKYFGALVLGIMQHGKLKYIGHTGTGFTDSLLKEIYNKLQPLIRNTSPFDQKVIVNAPVTWLDPVLVCNIKFSEITEDGILRHPVFVGLRIDKEAEETDHLDVAVKNKEIKNKHMSASAQTKSTKPTSTADKLSSSKDKSEVKVNNHKLIITNQDKIYFPEEKITKGDVIEYYNSIQKFILPYLKDRPESLKRNPNGIIDKGFYHKDAGDDAPKWVKSLKIYSESTKKDVDYILCNDAATLMYLNNLGCIEINPWNSKIKNLDNPDYLIMDIDPSDNNTFDEVIDTALVIKQILDKAGAKGYCKTSGATGLHVYVPMHAVYSYDQVRAFAETIAILTQEQLPKTTTLERSLDKRKGRIYIDYLQNKRGQTLASAYSLRPVAGASVSMPLEWREVKHGLLPSQFTIKNCKKRLEKKGDIFSGVLKEKTNLEKCIDNLSSEF